MSCVAATNRWRSIVSSVFDGKRQRNALTGAEQALRALGSGNAERARKSAQKAADLDQVGLYTGLTEVVDTAASHLDRGEAIPESAWEAIGDVVGAGPLQGLVAEVRDG